MSKRQFLIILGVWVIAFLFLGFPSSWDKVFALLTGLLIITIAFKFKPLEKVVPADRVPYVEHKNNLPAQKFAQKPIQTPAQSLRSAQSQPLTPSSVPPISNSTAAGPATPLNTINTDTSVS